MKKNQKGGWKLPMMKQKYILSFSKFKME